MGSTLLYCKRIVFAKHYYKIQKSRLSKVVQDHQQLRQLSKGQRETASCPSVTVGKAKGQDKI